MTNVGISQGAIDEAMTIARDVWGMDVGTDTVPTGLAVSVKDTLLKLDWNISDAHRASLRYTKTAQTEPVIAGFSATGLSLSSWWWNQDKTIESVVGQWFADWTPNLSTELKVSKRDYASEPTPVNGARLPAIGLRFSGLLPDNPGVNTNNRFLNMGTELSRHFNVLETETVDVYAGATWNLGAHELKGGIDYAKNDVYNAFLQNVNGNYTFGCEPGVYTFGTVASCTGNYTPAGGGTAVAMTPALRETAVLENFRAGKPSAYTVQSPKDGRTLNDGVAIWSYTNTGVFLQDNFKVSPALRMMFGLRMDQQGVPKAPIANPDVAADMVVGSVTGTNHTRNTGGFGMDNTVTLDGNRLFQPRVGFNWDLGGKDATHAVARRPGPVPGCGSQRVAVQPLQQHRHGHFFAQLCQLHGTAPRHSTMGNCCSAPTRTDQPELTNRSGRQRRPAVAQRCNSPRSGSSTWPLKANCPTAGGGHFGGQRGMAAHQGQPTAVYYQHLNLGGATRTGSDGRELFYRQRATTAPAGTPPARPSPMVPPPTPSRPVAHTRPEQRPLQQRAAGHRKQEGRWRRHHLVGGATAHPGGLWLESGLHPHHGRGQPADFVGVGLQLEQPQHLQPQ
jgi:hypothetical protein